MEASSTKPTPSVFQDIRNSCAFVAENADHITINIDQIPDYIETLPLAKITTELRDDWHYNSGTAEEIAGYVLILDSINFGSGYFQHLKKRDGFNSGYATVAQCLKDHFIQIAPLTSEDLGQITAQTCHRIFEQPETSAEIKELMQMFADAMQEIGQHITERYNASFTRFIEAAEHSGSALIAQLTELSLFQDTHSYKEHEIAILKRAQITVADLYLAFQGQGLGQFNDIDELTIFADNVVPHVLRHDGILQYDIALTEHIDNRIPVVPGTNEEIELRACSIHAVELIVQEAQKQGHNVNAMNIDHILWARGHEDKYMALPRHATQTVFY